MPFKVNAYRRHHIPRQQDRVTNWSEYDAGLRQRGSLTVWFSEEAIAAWRAEPRTTRGGQPHYSALAITTALTLRVVFRLALRQTEGLIGSIIRLLGLDLSIPDHSTLSRRAETLAVTRPPSSAEPVHLLVDSTGLKLSGAGEWLVEKHGTSRRRSWRKLHICQTASNRDPGSASKRDPSRAVGQACPGSEQEGPARVAQCRHERRSGARGRCLFAHRGKPGWHSGAVFEAPALVAGFDDFAVMGQAVEERGCHLGVAKHTGPIAKG